MSDALAALRAGVVALLRARGAEPLADRVAAAGIELADAGETWSVGSRSVVAHRAVLVVDADAFVTLSAHPEDVETIRAAFAAAMQSPTTALAHLDVVLALPVIERGWHRVYRSAPVVPAEPPEPEAVLRGAERLLVARGDPDAAAMLARATLESAEIAATTPLMRYVLRLEPDDLVRAERDRDLAERLHWAIERAGTRAPSGVASVLFAADLGPTR